MLVLSSLEKAFLEKSASDPLTEILQGRFYLDSTNNWLKIYTGSVWRTLVDTNSAQALTNKDYDGGTASDTSRLTVPKAAKATIDALTRKEATLTYASDLDKLFIDDGTNLTEVGTGSSGGGAGINYITNYLAEYDTDGWSAYADAAAATPVDGTGGAPTITITRNTTNPLRQTGDFLITKDAANRQGEGVGYAFTINNADISKRLAISFDWKTSADYAANDIGVYVYDVTNATLIYPSSVNLPAFASGNAGTVITVFFNATTSVSYRLIFHVASTNASAYTCNFDNVSVGPQNVVQTMPSSDWTSYTPTLTTPTKPTSPSDWTETSYWRRIGSTMEIIYNYKQTSATGSSSGSGTYRWSIPSGYTIDTTKLQYSTTVKDGIGSVGSASATLGGTSGKVGTVKVYSSTTLSLMVGDEGTNPQLVADGWIGIGSNNVIQYSFYAKIPIAEWASSSVSLANSQVEYAFNTDVTDAADTTHFGYGPAGQLANYNFGAARKKRVRFLTPIQSTDNIKFQISRDGSTWIDFQGSFGDGTYEIGAFTGASIGFIGLNYVNITDIDVNFNRYPTGTSNWNYQTIYWRVVKSSNPLSIGQVVTPTSQVRSDTGNGHGSTNTKIRKITNHVTTGSDIVAVTDAALGTYYTILRAGVYSISYTDRKESSSGIALGISLNSAELTTSILSITSTNQLISANSSAAGVYANCSVSVILNVGDVIRPHTDGTPDNTTTNVKFVITQVAV
jgi:hypothetical protein